QNSILGIAQDSIGFLWFAAPDGLNRYDGNQIKFYPRNFDLQAAAKSITKGEIEIFENNLYMITRGGNLEKFDLKTELFYNLSEQNLSITGVRTFLIEHPGKIWLGTETQGLFLVNSKLEILKHFSIEGIGQFKISSNYINKIF